jgi:hypothetical protein
LGYVLFMVKVIAHIQGVIYIDWVVAIQVHLLEINKRKVGLGDKRSALSPSTLANTIVLVVTTNIDLVRLLRCIRANSKLLNLFFKFLL